MTKTIRLKNEVYIERDSCMIGRTNDINITINGAYTHYPTYPFDIVIAKTGNGLDISGNGVKVLKKSKFIKVSAMLNIDLPTRNVQMNICKNGGTVATFDSGESSGMTSIPFPEVIVPCTINDIITVNFGISAGGTYLTRGARSKLTTELIY